MSGAGRYRRRGRRSWRRSTSKALRALWRERFGSRAPTALARAAAAAARLAAAGRVPRRPRPRDPAPASPPRPGAGRGPRARRRRAAAPGMARQDGRGRGRGGRLPLGGAALPEPLGRGHGDRRHALERAAVLRAAAAAAMSKPVRRCALYTRKSSEEGLEQDFNSLDAQREACAAYVRSQAGEGWRALDTRYDDGGFSGGSMERPALKRLLADIAAGKVDVVVVYKIDRLTRGARRLRPHRRAVRPAQRQLRQRHPGVQHHQQHGPADAERAALLRAVRARGHRRAHPRQDRRLQGAGHVDGRQPAARLRPAGRGPAGAGGEPGRGGDRANDLRRPTSSSARSARSSAGSPSAASAPSSGPPSAAG